ncbi:MAG: hypothetical protein RIC55_25545 [Pirellulaceae bacterium]
MHEIAPGWNVQMDRGPNWLLMRVQADPGSKPTADEFCQQVWNLMQRHLTTRLVVEFDGAPPLDAEMIDHLGRLHDRIDDANGKLCVCGLSPDDEQSLRGAKVNAQRPISVFRNRTEAVMGYRPGQPR